MNRLALLAFGGLLVLLILGFAVTQGIGQPSVPSDAVAVIEDAPDGLGTLSKEELDEAIAQTAGPAGIKPIPKPGDPQYEELKETALEEAIDRIWVKGEAEELGVSVAPQELTGEIGKLKKQAFKSEAQFQEFLKETNFTEAAVEERVEVQMLSERIQQQVAESTSPPSAEEVEEYYEAAKESQFAKPETRDARAITNKDKAEAEATMAALEKDSTPANWKRLAAKSDNVRTKQSGGLLKNLKKGQAPEPLGAAIFAAPPAQLEGLLQGPNGYIVFEVTKVTPEKIQTLTEVKSQISSQLGQQAQQQESASLARNYTSKWRSRTFCGSDYLIERCANLEGDGRPVGAPPGCYEEDPKAPAPEACPAPVQQVMPAMPGSVSVLTPEGEKLTQRPRPSKLEPAGAGREPGVLPETPGN